MWRGGVIFLFLLNLACLNSLAWAVEAVPGEMVKIEGATFQAGLDPAIGFSECEKYSGIGNCQRELFEKEHPHQETVETFYFDKYETTQSEYEQVMENNPSEFMGCPKCPVTKVTWFEANTYCKKLGKRLPTEWEWEWAAKGGGKTIYEWGNNGDLAGEYAWYDKNSGGRTHPVGRKKPNGYGLYDTAGNVFDWTSSDYDSEGKYKVVRGGSWHNNESYMRPALRYSRWPGARSIAVGFRCAK